MQNSDFGEPHDTVCPNCGHPDLTHTVEQQAVRFAYGPGDVLMSTVQVKVPVTRCSKCGDAWTDGRAEGVREQAVLRRRDELNA